MKNIFFLALNFVKIDMMFIDSMFVLFLIITAKLQRYFVLTKEKME